MDLMQETLISTQAGPMRDCRGTSTADLIRMTTGIFKAMAGDIKKYLSRLRGFSRIQLRETLIRTQSEYMDIQGGK